MLLCRSSKHEPVCSASHNGALCRPLPFACQARKLLTAHAKASTGENPDLDNATVCTELAEQLHEDEMMDQDEVRRGVCVCVCTSLSHVRSGEHPSAPQAQDIPQDYTDNTAEPTHTHTGYSSDWRRAHGNTQAQHVRPV